MNINDCILVIKVEIFREELWWFLFEILFFLKFVEKIFSIDSLNCLMVKVMLMIGIFMYVDRNFLKVKKFWWNNYVLRVVCLFYYKWEIFFLIIISV